LYPVGFADLHNGFLWKPTDLFDQPVSQSFFVG
jgi:hypothetical protein